MWKMSVALQFCRNIRNMSFGLASQKVLVWFEDISLFLFCFEGPDQEQQKVEAHHTVVFGDGDCVQVQNEVSFLH